MGKKNDRVKNPEDELCENVGGDEVPASCEVYDVCSPAERDVVLGLPGAFPLVRTELLRKVLQHVHLFFRYQLWKEPLQNYVHTSHSHIC